MSQQTLRNYKASPTKELNPRQFSFEASVITVSNVIAFKAIVVVEWLALWTHDRGPWFESCHLKTFLGEPPMVPVHWCNFSCIWFFRWMFESPSEQQCHHPCVNVKHFEYVFFEAQTRNLALHKRDLVLHLASEASWLHSSGIPAPWYNSWVVEYRRHLVPAASWWFG